jgi:hypothetical protein
MFKSKLCPRGLRSLRVASPRLVRQTNRHHEKSGVLQVTKLPG